METEEEEELDERAALEEFDEFDDTAELDELLEPEPVVSSLKEELEWEEDVPKRKWLKLKGNMAACAGVEDNVDARPTNRKRNPQRTLTTTGSVSRVVREERGAIVRVGKVV